MALRFFLMYQVGRDDRGGPRSIACEQIQRHRLRGWFTLDALSIFPSVFDILPYTGAMDAGGDLSRSRREDHSDDAFAQAGAPGALVAARQALAHADLAHAATIDLPPRAVHRRRDALARVPAGAADHLRDQPPRFVVRQLRLVHARRRRGGGVRQHRPAVRGVAPLGLRYRRATSTAAEEATRARRRRRGRRPKFSRHRRRRSVFLVVFGALGWAYVARRSSRSSSFTDATAANRIDHLNPSSRSTSSSATSRASVVSTSTRPGPSSRRGGRGVGEQRPRSEVHSQWLRR